MYVDSQEVTVLDKFFFKNTVHKLYFNLSFLIMVLLKDFKKSYIILFFNHRKATALNEANANIIQIKKKYILF